MPISRMIGVVYLAPSQ